MQGSYNLNTGRVCFTKKYRAGTGDAHENLGHSVEYRGTFQGSLAAGLRGSWFVNTHRYTGEGEFHLWPELWEVQASTPLGALARNLFSLHAQADAEHEGLDFSSIQKLYRGKD